MWLVCFKIIAFSRSSTDNINELIQDSGPYLYPLLILFPLNALAIAHATLSLRTRNIISALLIVAVSLPVGWVLFRSGLSSPVEKYGFVFRGAYFLLGPDRREILPQNVLMMRWAAIQLMTVGALAFGMRILILRRPTASAPPEPPRKQAEIGA